MIAGAVEAVLVVLVLVEVLRRRAVMLADRRPPSYTPRHRR